VHTAPPAAFQETLLANHRFVKHLIGILIAIAGFFVATTATAENLIVSRGMLEDKAGTLTIAQAAASQFTPTGPTLAQGYSDSVYWLRLRVRRPSTGSKVVLSIGPAQLDEVRLYERDAGDPREWITRVTGDRYAYDDRDRGDIALGFAVDVLTAERTFYLRIKSASTLQATVEALEPQQANRQSRRADLVRNIFIGLMLWALIWAIDHYLVEREPAVGLFALHQGVYILYGLGATGNLAPFAPYDCPQLADWLSNIAACAASFTFLLFSRALLKLYAPPLLRGFYLFFLAFPIQLAAMAFDYTQSALSLGSAVSLAGAWYCVALAFAARQEQVPSRNALRAVYIVLALFATVFSFSDFGWFTLVDLCARREWALITQGIASSGLICTVLYMRLRQSRKDAQQSAVTLALSQQALEIERAHKKQAQVHARTDYLTGLCNRRHFVELAERELAQATASGKPLSLLMMDVDHFKTVNDTWGHQGGDAVLRQVAARIRGALREQDILGRIGGEEFAAVLIGADKGLALEIAQRIRATIADTVVALPNGQSARITLSLGLTQLSEHDASLDDLLHKADAALYRAKDSGRDIVVAA